MNERKWLDRQLSRALGLKLQGCFLNIINSEKYVLTLDYAIKMLNIHERIQCGSPVIIEGETGVGKTALVEMLSKLWNQSLLLEWEREKDRLKDFVDKTMPGLTREYQKLVSFVAALLITNQ